MSDEVVPAIHFENAEDAEAALDAYARAKALLDAWRDVIVRGSVAVKVPATDIQRRTGVARTTTERVVAAQGKTAAVPFVLLPEYVVVLRHRASVTSAGGGADASGRATTYRNLATRLEAARGDLDLVPTDDGRLHAVVTEYTHALPDVRKSAHTDNAGQREFVTGQIAAMEQVIEEMTGLRRRGMAALEDLPADERQALADAADRDALQIRAWAAGCTPEEVAAMTDEQFDAAVAEAATREEEL